MAIPIFHKKWMYFSNPNHIYCLIHQSQQPIHFPSSLPETLPSPPAFIISNPSHSKTVCDPLNSFISSAGLSSVSAKSSNLFTFMRKFIFVF